MVVLGTFFPDRNMRVPKIFPDRNMRVPKILPDRNFGWIRMGFRRIKIEYIMYVQTNFLTHKVTHIHTDTYTHMERHTRPHIATLTYAHTISKNCQLLTL